MKNGRRLKSWSFFLGCGLTDQLDILSRGENVQVLGPGPIWQLCPSDPVPLPGASLPRKMVAAAGPLVGKKVEPSVHSKRGTGEQSAVLANHPRSALLSQFAYRRTD